MRILGRGIMEFTLDDLLDWRENLASGEGTAQAYIDTTLRGNLLSSIDGVVEAVGGVPEDYSPPEEPLLDISGALGILCGIQHAVGVLAPEFATGVAGALLKRWIDEMMAYPWPQAPPLCPP